MSTSWDNARKHARALETALDAKLSAYSKLAASIARSSSLGNNSRDEQNMEEEGIGGHKLVEENIEELLSKLEQAIEDLTTLINSPNQAPSTSMQHTAQTHRDNLDDYRRDFIRTRVGHRYRNRADLKSNVEQTIRRSNLLGSVRKDIDQAYATREDFAQQRGLLASIDTRMGGVLNQMPGINSLITMIRTRRRRDTIIMGCVVGVCVVLLFGYMFGF
ncbi:uncharacterized protein L203_105174 [Cryptococcus depauperatus CBS 7841]|uniref:Golgi SNAP receptor complex member 1 n=1 Tax=Cryptococcus depauperatus CBS 7841 TaxID=1295531 RepID=A0AAJ8JX44_9TREE